MKKIVLIIFVIILVFTTACSKKEDNGKKEPDTNVSDNESDYIAVNEIGLKYKNPESWKKYEETNLYPITVSTENTLAKIRFCYITDENLEKIKTASEEFELNDFLYPFCEIVVFKSEDIEEYDVKAIFNNYETADKIAEQKGYSYYMFSGYKNKQNFEFTEEQDKIYSEFSESVPKLKESIVTFDFNPNQISEKEKELNRTITFITKTLEGDDIDSSIFSGYKLTMINFWGSYSYPDINESKVLQELYKKLNSDHLTIGEAKLIQAIIDTPSKEGSEAEDIAKKAKKDVKGEYTSIIMDTTLATWAQNNLNGIPTTIFVDSNAQVVGEPLEGAKSVDEYWEAFVEAFNSF